MWGENCYSAVMWWIRNDAIRKTLRNSPFHWLLFSIDGAVHVWVGLVSVEVSPPLPSSFTSMAAAKPTLHSEGRANTAMLTYRIWVGPSAFKKDEKNGLSALLSSFCGLIHDSWLVKAHWGFKPSHALQVVSERIPWKAKAEYFEDRSFKKKERERGREGGREGAFGCYLNAKSGHIFFLFLRVHELVLPR